MRPKLLQVFFAIAVVAVATTLGGCGGESPSATTVGADPGPVHVHGLGVNPADASTMIATHTGVWRLPKGANAPTRVADRFQDTMGFAIAGPNRFVGSGHPDMTEDLPPFLGFIDSRDAGESWANVSLLGEADFHVLEISGSSVYGFGSDFKQRSSQFLTSGDGGRTWAKRPVPEAIISLAIDPNDPMTVVASGDKRLFMSSDAGQNWRPVSGPAGLLVWRQKLEIVSQKGLVSATSRPGQSFRRIGRIGGQPAAFDSGDNNLLVALHDGTIKVSRSGRSWRVLYRP